MHCTKIGVVNNHSFGDTRELIGKKSQIKDLNAASNFGCGQFVSRGTCEFRSLIVSDIFRVLFF
jgi:hypothetical protein